MNMNTYYEHLLTILYADQQSINKVPKIWGQLNEKGNGSSPDPFLARLRRALRKKGLARETNTTTYHTFGPKLTSKQRTIDIITCLDPLTSRPLISFRSRSRMDPQA